MTDTEVLRERLALLAEYIADLEAERDISLQDFMREKCIRRYIERTLHLAVESCLDIAGHIISAEGLREPIDNKDIFVVLGEAGYLSDSLVKKLVKMAQFRNIIVHDYARLDPEIVWGILKRDVEDLKVFMKEIRARFGV
ncbi:MAG: type VII toxin-antitoxin system HepT family RNase toxin [Moorellaceae bacterium]